jgi:ankyrin repeat protein
MSQHAELADALVSHGADVHVVDKEGVSALVLASYFGLSKVVKSLIQKGSNVHATALDGMTSLIVASSEGHVDIVRFIADFDPSTLNAKDEDGTNALMVACANSNVEMVKTLVEKGININDQNLDGHTALIFAMNTKRQIDVLLEKYKDFLTTSNENDNSLTMIKAARESQIRVIEFLRNSGADASIKVK